MLVRDLRLAAAVAACLVALTCARVARAEAPALSVGAERVSTAGHVDVLVDADHALTIDTITSVPEDRWRLSTDPRPNFGFSTAAIWTRMRLSNPGDATTRRIVFQYPLHDRIELYASRPGGGFTRTLNGDRLPLSERPVQSHLLMFDVDLPAQGETVVYARITNSGSMQIGADVMTPAASHSTESDSLFFHGAYYGLMLALGIYNLFLFFTTRTRAYLFYVLYVLAFTGTQMALDGTGARYFFPESPGAGNTFVPLMVSLLLNPPLLFAQEFLDTKRWVPRWHRVVSVMIAINWIPPLISLFAPYSLAIRVAGGVAMPVCVVCLVLGVIVMRKGYRPARFYVLAWSAVLVGTILYGLVAWDVLPSNAFFLHVQKVGGALEVMLLSFALGDRITTLNAERDAARSAAREMERDLAVSATVQRLFLPRDDAFESPSIALRGYYSPAAQSGGDWWWYEVDDDGRVRVLLGDVTGHGVGAAMVTGAVAAAYRAMPDATRRGDVRRVIDGLNQSLADICAGAHHMTLGALEIDARAGVVHMWSAGAPAALVLHADGTVEALAARGSALGEPSIRVGMVTERVAAGDRIFVFSDGLSELDLVTGRPLGYRGVTRMLQGTLGKTAAEAVDALAAELRSLVAAKAQHDDIAFVIVDVLEQAETRKAA